MGHSLLAENKRDYDDQMDSLSYSRRPFVSTRRSIRAATCRRSHWNMVWDVHFSELGHFAIYDNSENQQEL